MSADDAPTFPPSLAGEGKGGSTRSSIAVTRPVAADPDPSKQ